MCLSYWEALQVAVERGGRAALDGEQATQNLVAGLYLLVAHGPPVLAVSPGVQEILTAAVGRLRQVRSAQGRRSAAV